MCSRKQHTAVSGVLLALLSLSCSGQFRRGHKKHDDRNTDSPTSEVELSLTPEALDHFHQWQQTLLKSCDAASAIQGVPSNMPLGIDGRSFLARNGGSMAIRGDHGEFAYLGEPSTKKETSSTKVENALAINGVVRKLTVSAESNERSCQILIDGKLAYETEIWNAVPVVAYGSGAFEKPIENTADHDQELNSNFSDMIETLTSAHPDTDPLRAMLGTKFPEMSQTQIEDLFPRSHVQNQRFVAWVVNDTLSPMADNSFSGIVGDEQLTTKLANQQGSIELQARIRPPKIQIGDSKNDADTKLWGLSAAISWKTELGFGRNLRRRYSLTSLSGNEGEPSSDTRFANCVTDRLKFASQLRLAHISADRNSDTPPDTTPYFDDLFSPCVIFADDLAAAMDSSAEIRSFIGTLFQDSSHLDYNHRGWHGPLTLLARYYFDHQTSLTAQLDPQGQSKFLKSFESHMSKISLAINARATLIGHRDQLLENLPWEWAKLSDSRLNDRQMDQYFDALANVIDLLPASTNSWLESLQYPDDRDELISSFALSLTTEEKEALSRAQSLAAEVGLDKYLEGKKLGQFLQNHKHGEPIDRWNDTLSALQDFQSRDRSKATEKELSSYGEDFHPFAVMAFDEGWTNDDLHHLENLALVGQYGSEADDIHTVLHIITSLELSRFSKESSRSMLSAALVARYATLAIQLDNKLQLLSEYSLGKLRSAVAAAFYQPIWLGAGEAKFSENSTRLLSLLDQVKQAAAQQRSDLISQITTLLAADTQKD